MNFIKKFLYLSLLILNNCSFDNKLVSGMITIKKIQKVKNSEPVRAKFFKKLKNFNEEIESNRFSYFKKD